MRLRNRRGATMILIGLSIIAMVGLSAFAIDFSRMYLFRAQVHSSADAAALAGAIRLGQRQFTGAADTAVNFGQLNLVDNTTPTIATTNIEPGTWNYSTRTFSPQASALWSDTLNNAVRATSTYNASYGFGRFFGMTTRARTAVSVAAVGTVGSTDCVRPWAIPYQVMLDELFGAGVQSANTYQLTASDVARLSALTLADTFFLKVGDPSATVTNGNFYGVKLPPVIYANGTLGNPWNGANSYGTAIGETCAQLAADMAARGAPPTVGIGDWLQPENGNMPVKTGDGVATLCTANGGITPSNGGGNRSFRCNTPTLIKAAIWATSGNAPPPATGCGGKCFQIKYLGVFYVTGYEKGGGGAPDGVIGYFNGMISSGTFAGMAGPVKNFALVQ